MEWDQFLDDANIAQLEAPYEDYNPLSIESLKTMTRDDQATSTATIPDPSTQYVIERFAEEEQLPTVTREHKHYRH